MLPIERYSRGATSLLNYAMVPGEREEFFNTEVVKKGLGFKNEEINRVSKSSTLSNKVVKGFKWSYISSAVNALLHLGVLSVLAHLLSPRDFGLLQMAYIFTSLAERVGQIGIGPAIVQRAELSPTHISAGSTLAVLTGILLSSVLFALAPLAGTFFMEPDFVPVLRAISSIFLIESFGMVSESLLQRELRFKELMIADNASYILGPGVIGIALAYAGYGVWSLVFATLSQRIIKTLILNYSIPFRCITKIPRKESGELIKTGFGFSLSRILNYLALQSDNMVVSKVLGTTAVGFYGRAYQVMTLPATYFAQVLDKVLFSAMAKKQKDRERLKQIFLYGSELVAFISLPATVFMYFAGSEIIVVLFGAHWSSTIPVFTILALGVFFRTAYKTSDTLVRAMGAVYRHAGQQAIYALCVLVGAGIGCRWGVEGVGVGVFIAVGINFAMMSAMSLRLLDLSVVPFLKAHLPAVWSSTALGTVLYLVLPILRTHVPHPLARLIFAAGGSGIVIVVATLLAPQACKLRIVSWFIGNLPFTRYGAPGRAARVIVSKMGVHTA